jgi:hypothetical protein
MGGILKIAAIAIALWVAAEFYTHGIDGAFNGLFATTNSNPLERTASAPQRVKHATERAFQEGEDRRDRMLGN